MKKLYLFINTVHEEWCTTHRTTRGLSTICALPLMWLFGMCCTGITLSLWASRSAANRVQTNWVCQMFQFSFIVWGFLSVMSILLLIRFPWLLCNEDLLINLVIESAIFHDLYNICVKHETQWNQQIVYCMETITLYL